MSNTRTFEPTREDPSRFGILNRTPITQEVRARIDKWDCIKLKNFCTAMEITPRMKSQHTE
jgi:hypothetical protein